MIFLMFFVPLLAAYIIHTGIRMKDRFSAEEKPQTTVAAASDVSVGAQQAQSSPMPQQTGSLKPEDLVPTLAEKPESKPIYDSVRQVKTFEYIAGCVDGGKSGCTCYSSQGTPLKEITKVMCQDYARNGLPFNPYKDEAQVVQQPQNVRQTAYTPEGGQVLSMGGQSPQNLMYDGYVEAGNQFRQTGGLVN